MLTQRAYSRAKLDRAADAQADIDEALRLAPKAALTIAVAGLVHEKHGEREKPASAYRKHSPSNPNCLSRSWGWSGSARDR